MVSQVALNGTPGEVAQRAILWVAGQGNSGTGTRIKALHGAARQGATFARAGFGTIANGGFGMAGGKTVLSVAGNTVAVAGVAACAVSFVVNERRKQEAALKEAQERIVLCVKCQGLLPAADDLQATPACPHDEHVEAPDQD